MQNRYPVELRSLAFVTLGRGVGKRVGLRIYETAIAHCVSEFLNFSSDVRLIRGSVSRCVPGVSDLDFLLVNQNDDASLYPALQKKYLQLRRRYPMLGGLQVVNAPLLRAFTRSPSGSRLWYSEQKLFRRFAVPTRMDIAFQVAPSRRFAVGLFHFVRAQVQWHFMQNNSVVERPFYRANYHRELRKCGVALNRDDRPTDFFSYAASLDALATTCLKHSRPPTFKPTLCLKKREEPPFYNRVELDAFRKIEKTSNPTIHFTASMWAMYQNGWCWDDLNTALGILTTSPDVEKSSVFWFQTLYDRFLTLLVSQWVAYFKQDQNQLRTDLRNLCRMAIMLATNNLSNDDSYLLSIARNELPNTVRLFNFCSEDRFPWLAFVVAALEEMNQWVLAR